MKLDPRAARALHREWVELRGGFFVGAEALAKLEGIAFLRDLVPVTNGEELVRMLEACEVEQCASCKRRVPSFCGWCVIMRLPGVEKLARAERAAQANKREARDAQSVTRRATASAHDAARNRDERHARPRPRNA